MSRNSPSGTFAGCTRTSAGGHQAPRAVNGRRGWMFSPNGGGYDKIQSRIRRRRRRRLVDRTACPRCLITARLPHEVSAFASQTRWRNGGGGYPGVERERGRQWGLYLLRKPDYHQIAFSARRCSSLLPDPRSVRKAMGAPDADGRKGAMDKEM